jgi:hypothetical protein
MKALEHYIGVSNPDAAKRIQIIALVHVGILSPFNGSRLYDYDNGAFCTETFP